jgi:hypothetical protein
MVAEKAESLRAVECCIGKPITQHKVDNFSYQIHRAFRSIPHQCAPDLKPRGGYSYSRAKKRR